MKVTLTHEEACSLVERSLERAVNTLLYIRERLKKKMPFDQFDQAKLNKANLLCNVNWYGAYLNGLQTMLVRLRERGLCDEPQKEKQKEGTIYNKAILDLLMSSAINLERFVEGEYDICFADHVRDRKGKLKSCRAYFAKETTNYIEVK